MRRSRFFHVCVLSGIMLLWSRPAAAQFRPYSTYEPATGERYHIEFAAHLWNPMPEMTISSQSLGIPGDDIDFVTDLGIVKKKFPALRLVLRPSVKSKFRIEYIPIKYDADTVLTRSFVFNGIRYTVGLPVTAELEWRAYRFAYEYDMVYKDRGFFGLVLEAKYTDVRASVSSFIGSEFARARAPIPAIGGIGRVYVMPNISITGEISGFSLKINERNRGTYLDLDIYGTVNFINSVGAQIGYRSLDVDYRIKDDAGNLKLKGLYFGAVVRF
ncbi:MAG: hypothetical protein HYX76_15340 [Acidobacteria bacterium]|nr:hypothetical protein [Acidobacteriota bacterium]